jgi:hypothetical protein
MNIGRAQSILEAWKVGAARDADLAELRDVLPAILDDAIAWRKGVDVLRELQARVMPCGHELANLIGGTGSVTKCGQCLADKRASEINQFYIQDTRQYVGNCVYWWAKDAKGYTCHIDNAMTVSETEARQMEQSRGTDRAWSVAQVRAAMSLQVDKQRLIKT